MSITIGIDIGGTFTDVVSLDNESGELQYTKVNSTSPQARRRLHEGRRQRP